MEGFQSRIALGCNLLPRFHCHVTPDRKYPIVFFEDFVLFISGRFNQVWKSDLKEDFASVRPSYVTAAAPDLSAGRAARSGCSDERFDRMTKKKKKNQK